MRTNVLAAAGIESVAAPFAGRPCTVDILKDKPGRRRTARVTGPSATVIVKAYASDRAATVAARVTALASGPDEPLLPRVLHLDIDRRVVVLSQVPGRSLSALLADGDASASYGVGAALGRWHRAWTGEAPTAMRPHGIERELELLTERAADATPGVARAVRVLAPRLAQPWLCSTVVHRDLYDEQIVIGDHVGLIDLDDAAAGPAELDVGNLLAHLALFAHRHHDITDATEALLTGYRTTGPPLDRDRLHQCTWLSRLRLACIHDEPALLEP